MDTVKRILALYKETYGCRVGRYSALLNAGQSIDDVDEGDLRMRHLLDCLTNTGVTWQFIDQGEAGIGHEVVFTGLDHFKCVIRAIEDVNPDPRETDCYGTYLSMAFHGLGPFENLRIKSKNEDGLFVRFVESSFRPIDDASEVVEQLTILRRRWSEPATPELKQAEESFVEAFRAATSRP